MILKSSSADTGLGDLYLPFLFCPPGFMNRKPKLFSGAVNEQALLDAVTKYYEKAVRDIRHHTVYVPDDYYDVLTEGTASANLPWEIRARVMTTPVDAAIWKHYRRQECVQEVMECDPVILMSHREHGIHGSNGYDSRFRCTRMLDTSGNPNAGTVSAASKLFPGCSYGLKVVESRFPELKSFWRMSRLFQSDRLKFRASYSAAACLQHYHIKTWLKLKSMLTTSPFTGEDSGAGCLLDMLQGLGWFPSKVTSLIREDSKWAADVVTKIFQEGISLISDYLGDKDLRTREQAIESYRESHIYKGLVSMSGVPSEFESDLLRHLQHIDSRESTDMVRELSFESVRMRLSAAVVATMLKVTRSFVSFMHAAEVAFKWLGMPEEVSDIAGRRRLTLKTLLNCLDKLPENLAHLYPVLTNALYHMWHKTASRSYLDVICHQTAPKFSSELIVPDLDINQSVLCTVPGITSSRFWGDDLAWEMSCGYKGKEGRHGDQVSLKCLTESLAEVSSSLSESAAVALASVYTGLSSDASSDRAIEKPYTRCSKGDSYGDNGITRYPSQYEVCGYLWLDSLEADLRCIRNAACKPSRVGLFKDIPVLDEIYAACDLGVLGECDPSSTRSLICWNGSPLVSDGRILKAIGSWEHNYSNPICSKLGDFLDKGLTSLTREYHLWPEAYVDGRDSWERLFSFVSLPESGANVPAALANHILFKGRKLSIPAELRSSPLFEDLIALNREITKEVAAGGQIPFRLWLPNSISHLVGMSRRMAFLNCDHAWERIWSTKRGNHQSYHPNKYPGPNHKDYSEFQEELAPCLILAVANKAPDSEITRVLRSVTPKYLKDIFARLLTRLQVTQSLERRHLDLVAETVRRCNSLALSLPGYGEHTFRETENELHKRYAKATL